MSDETSAETPFAETSVHQGHDPETGWLHRMRHWDDVLPPIRLFRIMRGLASPVLLGIILVTFLIDDQVCRVVDAVLGSAICPSPVEWVAEGHFVERPIVVTNESALVPVRSVWESLIPPIQVVFDSALDSDSLGATNAWQSLAKIFVRIFLWTGPLLILMRQGACLTAGRNMDSAKSTFRLAVSRIPPAGFLILVPSFCSLVFAIAAASLGWISAALPDVAWMASGMALLVVLVALPAGFLLAASITSVPLGLAAIVNESHPDPLDALSRGYESTLRGSLALVGNILVGCAIMVPVVIAAAVVAWVSEAFLYRIIHLVGSGEMMFPIRFWLNWMVPTALMTAIGLLVGGIYLLMRRHVGGQEVEDLWVLMPKPKPNLPILSTGESDLSSSDKAAKRD